VEVPEEELLTTLTPTPTVSSNWGSQFLPFILAGMFLFALIALVLVFLIVKKARTNKKDAKPVVEEKVEEVTTETEKDSEVEENEKEDVKEESEPDTKDEPVEEGSESED